MASKDLDLEQLGGESGGRKVMVMIDRNLEKNGRKPMEEKDAFKKSLA